MDIRSFFKTGDEGKTKEKPVYEKTGDELKDSFMFILYNHSDGTNILRKNMSISDFDIEFEIVLETEKDEYVLKISDKKNILNTGNESIEIYKKKYKKYKDNDLLFEDFNKINEIIIDYLEKKEKDSLYFTSRFKKYFIKHYKHTSYY
jgi:hypothetical protein